MSIQYHNQHFKVKKWNKLFKDCKQFQTHETQVKLQMNMKTYNNS